MAGSEETVGNADRRLVEARRFWIDRLAVARIRIDNLLLKSTYKWGSRRATTFIFINSELNIVHKATSEELNTEALYHKNDIVIDAVKKMHGYTLRSEATIHIHHDEIDH